MFALQSETGKLLLEKGKTRDRAQLHTALLSGEERSLLLGSWEDTQGLGTLLVRGCPHHFEILSLRASRCRGRAAQPVSGLLRCHCWSIDGPPKSPSDGSGNGR